MKLRYFVLWALIFNASLSFAFTLATPKKSYYSTAFYNDVNAGLSGAELIAELHREISKNHVVLGYDRARTQMMGSMYLQQDTGGKYFIHDVYCLKDYTGSGVGPHSIPDNAYINTEHTWPQSRFTNAYPKDMQKSDLHHLFPTDSKMNSTRGNFKFAEIDGKLEPLKCDTAKFGRQNGGYRFEPPSIHKGNVARALFYFSVRYDIHIDADEEAYLKKWHVEDPVDQEEITHNDEIAKTQGNRNPFIDHPELVEQIENF